MTTKSSSEYMRRKGCALHNINVRETGKIRYENKRPAISREEEKWGMEEYVVFQPNLRNVEGRIN